MMYFHSAFLIIIIPKATAQMKSIVKKKVLFCGWTCLSEWLFFAVSLFFPYKKQHPFCYPAFYALLLLNAKWTMWNIHHQCYTVQFIPCRIHKLLIGHWFQPINIILTTHCVDAQAQIFYSVLSAINTKQVNQYAFKIPCWFCSDTLQWCMENIQSFIRSWLMCTRGRLHYM